MIDWRRAIGSIIKMVCCLVIWLLICCALWGCTTTRIVEVETVRSDTTYITKLQKDSVWLHDSIHVKEKGDTILIEKWHTQWKERLLIDTLYQTKTDSIFVVKTIEKKQELSWWQKLRMTFGDVMLMLIMAAVIYGLWRLKRSILP